MAVKPLEIHPSDLAELKSALTWYLERNQITAVKFAAEVDRAVSLVIDSPARWPSGEHGTRKFVLRRFPFAIVYREKQSAVQILAIAHGHRHPGYWKGRL
jgi:plasmid stabilization system protein ParE